MKRPPSFFKRVWNTLRGSRQATPRKPVSPPRKVIMSALEPLEGRIAPAALINPTTLVYKDLDGDIVTVKFSKALFTQVNDDLNLAKANEVFKFKDGSLVTGTVFDPASPAQQLSLIDLTKAPTNLTGNLANGTSVKITAVKGSLTVGGNTVPGDGFADIGYLKATGLSLATVSISGDLAQIDAGKSGAATGIGSLSVKSMGWRGLDTQIAAGASLDSQIIGALGALKIKDDFTDATLRAVNGTDFQGNITTLGKIGSITIGGSLIGRAAVEVASNNTGLIESATHIGAVKIGTDSADGVLGGGGKDSGAIIAAGKITSVTVSGNLTAGGGIGSGVISTGGAMGAVKISGDIDATAVNAGVGAGGIQAGGNLASITVLGALKGGSQTHSGFVSGQGDVGSVVVHDILGGGGSSSGSVSAAGKIASVTIAGNLTGGTGFGSGSIFSGVDTALVGDLGAVKIGGKVQGGAQDNTGVISAGGKLAKVTIGPAIPVDQVLLQGGDGDFSGAIFSRGAMGAVKISGHVDGGTGDFSGSISSRDWVTPDFDRSGDMGAVTILGRLSGGLGADSGQIRADGKLASVLVGNIEGNEGARSGSIRAGQGLTAGAMGTVKIGSLTEGTGIDSGSIVTEGRIASITLAGNTLGGSVRAGDDIGAITFNLNVDGTEVSARGKALPTATSDLAIGTITIGGNVANAQFLAGYSTEALPVNGDAQIGVVLVKGNWTSTDLVAGVMDGGTPDFGNPGDVRIDSPDTVKIVAQIASIVINGNVFGTDAVNDHFGFTAQRIGVFKAGGAALPMNALADAQVFEVQGTSDVTVREVSSELSMSAFAMSSGFAKTGSGGITLSSNTAFEVRSGGLLTVNGGTLTFGTGTAGFSGATLLGGGIGSGSSTDGGTVSIIGDGNLTAGGAQISPGWSGGTLSLNVSNPGGEPPGRYEISGNGGPVTPGIVTEGSLGTANLTLSGTGTIQLTNDTTMLTPTGSGLSGGFVISSAPLTPNDLTFPTSPGGSAPAEEIDQPEPQTPAAGSGTNA